MISITVISVNKFCRWSSYKSSILSVNHAISIHSVIERPRHFHHFGNVLNQAMCSDDNPKLSFCYYPVCLRKLNIFHLCFYNHLSCLFAS